MITSPATWVVPMYGATKFTPRAFTARETGTTVGWARPELSVMVALYVPTGSEVALTSTLTVWGSVPDDCDRLSHPAVPLVYAIWLLHGTAPAGEVMLRLWEAGVAPPAATWKLKKPAEGVMVGAGAIV